MSSELIEYYAQFGAKKRKQYIKDFREMLKVQLTAFAKDDPEGVVDMLSVLPLDELLAGLKPEERLAGLKPEEREQLLKLLTKQNQESDS